MCQFEMKFKNCLLPAKAVKEVRELSGAFSQLFAFKWFQMTVDIAFRPCLSILGLITNLLIFKIIKNKKASKDFKNAMYKIIQLNAAFNFVYCLINSFFLANVCIFPHTSFCSSVYKNYLSQYFKIYIISFLGNSLRICSNITYLIFSISRFSVISSTKLKFLKRIESMKPRKLSFLIFLAGCLLSLFKMFDQKPNESYSTFDLNFPYYPFDIGYCEIRFENDVTKFFSFECSLFPILNLINNILNNVLFLLVSVIVDIFLYRFAKMYVEEKTKMFHDQTHKDEALQHQKKINRLILINGALYFVSHLPEFILTLFAIMIRKKLVELSFYYNFTSRNLIETSEAF